MLNIVFPQILGGSPGSYCFHLFQRLMHSAHCALLFDVSRWKWGFEKCSWTGWMVQHQRAALRKRNANSWRSELPASILNHQSQKTGCHLCTNMLLVILHRESDQSSPLKGKQWFVTARVLCMQSGCAHQRNGGRLSWRFLLCFYFCSQFWA